MLIGQHVALHEPSQQQSYIGLICTKLSPVQAGLEHSKVPVAHQTLTRFAPFIFPSFTRVCVYSRYGPGLRKL